MSKSVVLKISRGDSGDARLKCVSLGHVCTQKEEPQRHSERGLPTSMEKLPWLPSMLSVIAAAIVLLITIITFNICFGFNHFNIFVYIN